jgi:hypothetical protein
VLVVVLVLVVQNRILKQECRSSGYRLSCDVNHTLRTMDKQKIIFNLQTVITVKLLWVQLKLPVKQRELSCHWP